LKTKYTNLSLRTSGCHDPRIFRNDSSKTFASKASKNVATQREHKVPQPIKPKAINIPKNRLDQLIHNTMVHTTRHRRVINMSLKYKEN